MNQRLILVVAVILMILGVAMWTTSAVQSGGADKRNDALQADVAEAAGRLERSEFGTRPDHVVDHLEASEALASAQEDSILAEMLGVLGITTAGAGLVIAIGARFKARCSKPVANGLASA